MVKATGHGNAVAHEQGRAATSSGELDVVPSARTYDVDDLRLVPPHAERRTRHPARPPRGNAGADPQRWS